jgi:hypothetical protein
MGYLIKGSDLIIKQIIIPEAIFQSLNFTVFQLLPATTLGAYNIINATITSKGTGSGYSGFGHLYLENFGRCGVYDEIAGQLNYGYYNNFMVNMSHPPNIFSAVMKNNYALNINAELQPSGNGDVLIELIYTIVNF